MVVHRHGDGRALFLLLHDDVAAFLANFYETVFGHDTARLFAGKDA